MIATRGRSSSSLFFLLACLAVPAVTSGGLVAGGPGEGVGTGPAVGSSFAAASFDIEGQPGRVLLAWRGAGGEVESGLLDLEQQSFLVFPAVAPGGSVTSLRAGSGGPLADRRALLVWVDGTLQLNLVVLDQDGALVGPPRAVASAVQVVPAAIAATAAGAFIGHAWDADPYWDPRVLAVDATGGAQTLQVVENALVPEQTLGVAVEASPAGARAVVYVVSDTHAARIRRYGDDGGAIDPDPVEFFGEAGGDYRPYVALFPQPGEQAPFLQLAVPSSTPQNSADLRLAYATLGAGEVILGPELSQLSPRFVGGAVDVAGLAGAPGHLVVLWQEVELQQDCGCSAPPPVRIEFLAQLLLAGNPPVAAGPSFTVYLWEDGDPIGPPLTEPVIAASGVSPGRFTVLWSDGLLRYNTIDALGPPKLALTQTPEGTVSSWTEVLAAQWYNVIRGLLADVTASPSGVDLGPVQCVEPASTDTTTEGWEDAEVPPTGETFFYLVETVFADGSRTLGTDSAGNPRAAGPGSCP